MPMDMPPQQVVEYRIAPAKAEAPKTIAQQVARFIGTERIRTEQKAGVTIGSFDAAQKLPPMDFSSPKLRTSERLAIAMVMRASERGRLGSAGVTMPDGYVARRMGAAIMTARLAERSQAGLEVTAKQIDAVRCRLVAVVMDPRASDYVKGGERTAAASREALSKGDVELCRPSIMAQAQRVSAQRTSVTPAATGAARAMTSTTPVAHRTAALGVVPKGTIAQRVDLVGSKRVSVTPMGSKGVTPQRVDLPGSKRVSLMPTGSKGVPVIDQDEMARRLAIVSRVLNGGHVR